MEDAEQIDAEYQHHGRNYDAEYERCGRIESEGGAKRSDDAAEHKERDEPTTAIQVESDATIPMINAVP